MEYIYDTKDIYIPLGDGRFTYETDWGGGVGWGSGEDLRLRLKTHRIYILF